MLITCIVVIITGISVAFAPNYEVYITMRILLAMGPIPCFIAYYTYGMDQSVIKSSYFENVFSLVNEISSLKWRTAVGVYANVTSSFSHTVLPILAFFLRDWRYLGLCVSLLCTPYLVIYFFIPKSPR